MADKNIKLNAGFHILCVNQRVWGSEFDELKESEKKKKLEVENEK